MMLLTEGALTLLDERAREAHVGDVCADEAAEPLAGCVEARGVVEPPNHRQHVVERYAHGRGLGPVESAVPLLHARQHRGA